MRPLLARLVLLLTTLLAHAWAGPARAQGEEPAAGSLAPRDVGMVVQPAAARVPAAPADFERVDDGWLTVELPGSVRDRAAALTSDADAFRTRLAGELGAPVLDHVLVRIARDPEQMAALAPEVGSPGTELEFAL